LYRSALLTLTGDASADGIGRMTRMRRQSENANAR
jgi:hypothetical protein